MVSWPSWRVIIGPWMLASLKRDLCGLSPILSRFPSMGSGVGPGGRLLVFVLRLLVSLMVRMYVSTRQIVQVRIVSIFAVGDDEAVEIILHLGLVL